MGLWGVGVSTNAHLGRASRKSSHWKKRKGRPRKEKQGLGTRAVSNREASIRGRQRKKKMKKKKKKQEKKNIPPLG
jgi:hypothetical protein